MEKKRWYRGDKRTSGLCNLCQEKPKAKGQRWCLDCKATYMREWRKTHPLTTKQKVKDSCRSYAHVYLRRGKITKQPCVVCGTMDELEMHHDDYTKPLQVTWYCKKHHHVEHTKLKKGDINDKEKTETEVTKKTGGHFCTVL